MSRCSAIGCTNRSKRNEVKPHEETMVTEQIFEVKPYEETMVTEQSQNARGDIKFIRSNTQRVSSPERKMSLFLSIIILYIQLFYRMR